MASIRITTKNNISRGPSLASTSKMSPMMFDGINGAVGAHSKGSKRWKKAVPAQVRKLRIRAIAESW
jgi:hypothetical protein